ncbi:hypothetical protein OLZ29_39245, partial [Rhizobium sp. 1AS13]|uniref:hypothetical protein n=1 Tax=Rhizobium acaciae TaxID=2989736 RepID=UPI002222D869
RSVPQIDVHKGNRAEGGELLRGLEAVGYPGDLIAKRHNNILKISRDQHIVFDDQYFLPSHPPPFFVHAAFRIDNMGEQLKNVTT